MANSVSEQCAHLERDRALYDHRVPSIALIPYFGGPPEAYGNSHSLSPRAIKLAQTKGAICAASRYFHQVAVGVCFPQDATDIRGLGFSFVEVLEVDCGGYGVHLSFVFFRKAQRLMAKARAKAKLSGVGGGGGGRAGAGHARVDWNVDAVYFTEADQVVYMDDVRTILASLGSEVGMYTILSSKFTMTSSLQRTMV